MQPKQFQSGTEYGGAWHWGSKCTEAGGTCSGSAINNALAEMPREHDVEKLVLGSHYNYYAATAESGVFAAGAYARANESICPKGWLLPRDSSSSNYSIPLSYMNLTYTSYGIPNAGGGVSARKHPLSFTNSNYYSVWGSLDVPTQGTYVTATTSGTNTKQYAQFYVTANATLSNENKAAGNSVRCILNPE